MNDIGLQGSVLYMINHGLSTGAMFLCVGMIYDRFHTRDIDQLSGLARKMPVLAFFFVFFVMSSIGLPGLNGFVSEFLTILGAFTSEHLGIAYGVFAALGVILGAVYMLHMTAKVIWGPLKYPGHAAHGQEALGHATDHHDAGDIGRREIAILIPIALAVVALGVYPGQLLDSIRKPVQEIRTPVRRLVDVSPHASPVAQTAGAKQTWICSAEILVRGTGFQPVLAALGVEWFAILDSERIRHGQDARATMEDCSRATWIEIET
jgi:NADH-quinone oxidoreductase subunit M